MGYVAAARKRSHQRRDLTSSSYTTDININNWRQREFRSKKSKGS